MNFSQKNIVGSCSVLFEIGPELMKIFWTQISPCHSTMGEFFDSEAMLNGNGAAWRFPLADGTLGHPQQSP